MRNIAYGQAHRAKMRDQTLRGASSRPTATRPTACVLIQYGISTHGTQHLMSGPAKNSTSHPTPALGSGRLASSKIKMTQIAIIPYLRHQHFKESL